MWDDTALIVTTDHGFLLGEHDWWAKIVMPCYNEVAHIPLFFHHPEFQQPGGQRCDALTQTIDYARRCSNCMGRRRRRSHRLSLHARCWRARRPCARRCIYGVFGSAVNITDGRYTYSAIRRICKAPTCTSTR